MSHVPRPLNQYRQYVLVSVITLSVFGLLTACGRGSNSDGLNAQSAKLPFQSADIDVQTLFPDGCLNLPTLMAKMKQLPKDVWVREYSQGFEMTNRAIDGKTLERFRNLNAEAAFSSFYILENQAASFVASYPSVQQKECQLIQFLTGSNQTETYEIVDSPDRFSLLIRKPDDSKEVLFKLLSPREMAIVTKTVLIDRCPKFQRVKAIVSVSRIWGTQAQLNLSPIRISRDFLQKIAIAADELPSALNTLLIEPSGDLVQPRFTDLIDLMQVSLDPRIARCPYHAKPPVADEAAPVEESENEGNAENPADRSRS